MSTDKVQLEIFNNHFNGIVEEMGYVIHRAAYTVFVKETWDFDTSLITKEGEIFCHPRNIGVGNMIGIDMGPAIACIDTYEPGDIIVTNDPKTTQGMCTHMPDIMLFKPLFYEDRLLCFAWCFVHSSDVGGLVPGSISPAAFDRYQEGICIPPTKLYSRGVLNEGLRDLILANCRIPEQNWGDMRALLASLTICERRMGHLVSRYGFDAVDDGIYSLLDYGESRAREILSKIPDGEYDFHDYVEVDYVSPYHVRLNVKLIVAGDSVTLDFSGTDPQVRAALNIPSFGRPNQWLVLAIVNFLRTTDPSLPLNRGILRSTSVKAPPGSVLNPTATAATGVRHTTGYRVADAVLGALSQAVPDAIPAAGAGQVAIVLFSHLDPSTGNYMVSVLQPMQGGSGARPIKDGIDGVNFSAGTLRNVPTESIELEAPVFVTKYMLMDEAAAGQYRGGTGVVLEFKCLASEAIVTARGMDRFKLRPYGRKGAEAGTLGSCILDPGTPKERQISKIEVLKLERGDVVRIYSPGGGGYGEPRDREPAKVLHDVVNSFVTPAAAEEIYGVVLSDGAVDDTRTEAARHRLNEAPRGAEFSFGKERIAYEQVLTPAFQDLVAALLADRPASVRQYARGRLYGMIERDPDILRLSDGDLKSRVQGELERVLSTGAAAVAFT
ncbi:N-methylhydantoinase B [Rhodoligotrophos appendicifer]|uniref:hydantoinase B/oxoprolinase family protein n=1 Tax=Rhodoligotrophos appendicifer TaxID=987056 RepID=UPI0014794E60|nr:hydantoinase B/oxoprolinase family protein [Rhodoligotrophos appendicifer]